MDGALRGTRHDRRDERVRAVASAAVATGRNQAIWPGFSWRFRRRLRRFDPEAYVLRQRT